MLSQAFTCVSLTWGKKNVVLGGITTLVCESQRGLSLICNQNLVFLPAAVSKLTSEITATLGWLLMSGRSGRGIQ